MILLYILLRDLMLYMLIGALISGILRGFGWSAIWTDPTLAINCNEQHYTVLFGWPVFVVINLFLLLFWWAPMFSKWLYRWLQRPHRKWRRTKQQDF